MIPESIYSLVRSPDTVTRAVARDPSLSPAEAAARLFPKHRQRDYGSDAQGALHDLKGRWKPEAGAEGAEGAGGTAPTEEDLARAEACGRFGSRASGLFRKMFHDILLTLKGDPLAGLVSPSLIGSRGVVVYSIISVIPDIIQHHHDVIVTAQEEVFLATNYWEASNSTQLICDALRELSRRAEARGKKVVVKMMYDRGNPRQAEENHLLVDEKEWTGAAVNLPPLSEIPGLSFQLVNFHRPLLGTFHAKYCIVDRRVALLCSNNIQDRPNLEMCCHFEGPIVDSFYDMALLSWSRHLDSVLPLIGANAPAGPYKFGMENVFATRNLLDGLDGAKSASEMRSQSEEQVQGQTDGKSFISGEWKSVTDCLNAKKQDTPATLPTEDQGPAFKPHILHAPHEEIPMALVNRRPHGRPGHGDIKNPQDSAWLAGMRYAERDVFIQTPTFNASPMVEATIAAVKRGVEVTIFADVGFNDGGEALPFQGGTNEEVAKKMFARLEPGEKANLRIYWYTAKDQDRPINAHINTRNCHIKLAIFDGQVGIQGNGNQDAQSWYHSQESNVMLDSQQVCAEWRVALEANQNTFRFGRVGDDGVWRNEDGNMATDGSGVTSGPKGLIKGIQGSILRVQGKGGF